ncbi:hypothetical protein GCM10027429_28250 [Marivirga atlantica]|jgi:hypothetical protein|uniref:Uncharacterized protein n=1 Tax=Marivirga atlantica TaxID=1548457 RepID=A0A937AJ53_9BACT|nr:hypothetical protein [Marivirga atlantica]MBL0767138.1 hypothetical protein [Marivirga atlantica]
MSWINKKIVLSLTALLIAYLGYGQSPCGNNLKLDNKSDSNFTVEIKTNSAYTCELYSLINGEYELLNSVNGYGNGLKSFNDLDNKMIYKVLVKFDSTNPLCESRQLSGITL